MKREEGQATEPPFSALSPDRDVEWGGRSKPSLRAPATSLAKDGMKRLAAPCEARPEAAGSTWRNLIATAIYLGLRKGEFSLRKQDSI